MVLNIFRMSTQKMYKVQLRGIRLLRVGGDKLRPANYPFIHAPEAFEL
jgi:hypothetical protein